MNIHPQYSLLLANDRIARELRAASDARHVLRQPSRIRRSVGRSIIRIGERLAAEPALRPARPAHG